MSNYIIFEGFRMDARTRDMLIEARKNCKAPLRITQGGFNAGGVKASAGTHDGGGALDIRAKDLTTAQRLEAVRRLRQVGFAAWLRSPSEGNWPWHIHCIAVGCTSLSDGAERQVVSYHNGRNGLKNNRKDTQDQLYVKNTWESYKALRDKLAGQSGGTSSGSSGDLVSLYAIDYAARGGAFIPTDSARNPVLADAEIVANWLRRLKIVTDRDVRVWDQFLRARNFRSAGLQYAGIVKRFQAHYGLTVDGVVGPVTKAKFQALLTHDNYRVVAK